MTVTLSDAQIMVLREFLEYSDAAIKDRMQLNNFTCEGCHIDYEYAKSQLSPNLTEAEWEQLCALFPPEMDWRKEDARNYPGSEF